MRFCRAGIFNILFLTLTILILLESPAFAQAEIVVSPKTVTINATRGETITRTIAVRTSEEINNVKVVALDAFSADNSVVLPSAAIEITTLPTQISVNELTSFPVTLNLQSAPSGEFTGEILLTYTGGEKSIPLIVRVKDPWLLPLMTLLVGIAISMAVSAYSSQGKLSDEITLSLKNISTQIDSDKAEARAFWLRAAMYLTIAKQAQDGQQLALAQTELDKAKAVWNKWLEQRPNWLIQFRYYDSLRQRLEQDDLKDSYSLYVQEIDRNLEQTLQSSPDLSTPDELKQRFDELSKQLNRYIRLKLQLEKLKNLIAVLEGEQLYEWEDKANDLTQRSQILLPSQDDEAQKLEDEINTSIEKLRELGANAAETFKSVDGNIELGLVLQPPSVKGAKPEQDFGIFPFWRAIASFWQTAKGRLRLFYLSSYLIAFIVLAGGGFNQLYWTKSTFGANSWGDYFALLAWGFGAEATRKVVTQVAGKTDS